MKQIMKEDHFQNQRKGDKYMPIREYKCKECGEEFEELILNIDEPNKSIKCPNCGCLKLEKLMSTGSFVIKGSY